MKTVREQFIRAHKVVWHFCANDMNIYLAPKRSFESNISKNICFHDERCFWQIIPCFIECDKPQGTIYKGLQAFPIIALVHIGALL